ncbi:hypothetical protein EMPS_05233 [Entomortierella parvispora]|uniref:Uncharacterized protein n=1 Tax=Entomortierella parvispora TaxID=205924 RepID=A0A9P3HAC6_9FUNG|nr:hypothetical protein EMPS_05233 [Entomortierella parvispora]
MTTPEALHPLCMTAAQDGTVYAVALAYWAIYDYTTSRYPDYLVAVKGSSPSGLAQDMVWTPLTATARTNTNIMAENQYDHVCAVSDDQTQFIIHSKAGDKWPRDRYPSTFSTRVILSGPHSNNTLNPTLWTTLDQLDNNDLQPIDPWVMVAVQDLASVNTTNTTSTSSTTSSLFVEWVRLSTNYNGLNYMQSIQGFFSQPLSSFAFGGSLAAASSLSLTAMAVQGKMFYGLSPSPQVSLLATPLTSFNSSSSPHFPAQLTITQSIAIQSTSGCGAKSSALTVQGSVAYIVCISLDYPSPPPTFMTVNIESGSVTQSPITYANKAIARKQWSYKAMAPSLVALSDKSFIYSDGLELPRLYYSIDINGYMDNYTLGDVQLFSSNNLNPNWWNSPLTLSTASSVMVSISTFLLAVLLIWAQEKYLRRRKRTWVDDADIPGSKVAEEMDEEAFRAYQREEQERVQRHVENQASLGRSPDRDVYSPYADVTVSSQFETSYTPSASTSRDALRESHSDPLGLGPLGFSSHPRPNVVTTIPDEESNDQATTRLP